MTAKASRPRSKAVRNKLRKSYRAVQQQIARTLDDVRQINEQKVLAAFSAFYQRQGEEVAKRFDAIAHSGSADTMVRHSFGDRDWTGEMLEAVAEPLRLSIVAGAMVEWNTFAEFYDVYADAAAIAALSKAENAPPSLNVDLPPDVLEGIRKQLQATLAMDYWSKVNETTRHALHASIFAGLENGETPAQLKARVRDVFGPDVTRSRAANIARTEVTGAQSAGQQAARDKLEEDGVVSAKEWFATMDIRTRNQHYAMDGKRVKPKADFVMPNGERCSYPGDRRLSGANRCHCRCHAASVPAWIDGSGGSPKPKPKPRPKPKPKPEQKPSIAPTAGPLPLPVPTPIPPILAPNIPDPIDDDPIPGFKAVRERAASMGLRSFHVAVKGYPRTTSSVDGMTLKGFTERYHFATPQEAIRVANQVLDYLEQQMKKHRGLRGLLSHANDIEIGDTSVGNGYGGFYSSSTGLLKAGVGGGPDYVTQAREGAAPWLAGGGAHYNLMHELGHAVDKAFANNARFVLAGRQPSKYATMREWAMAELSEYGGTNDAEFFAESFAKYTSTAYDGSLPKDVHDYFKKILATVDD